MDDVKAELNCKRQNTDCAPDAESAADKIPETKHVFRSDSELSGLLKVCGACANVFPDDIFSILITKSLIPIKKPFSAAFGVQDSFSSGKGFGVNQDESLFDIQSLDCAIEINRINIGQESESSVFAGFIVSGMGS